MTKLIWLLPIIWVSSGCSIIGSPNSLTKKSFAIHREWTRPTSTASQTQARLSNRMTPVLDEDLVIQGNGIDSIVAFNRKSGQVEWRLPIEGGVEAGAQVVDHQLYFGGNDGNFYSVSTKSGEVNWKFPINAQVLSTPLVKDGVIFILSGNNTLFALTTDGNQKWLYRRASGSTLSIRGGSQATLFGKILYIGMSDGYFVAVDSADGKLIWERQLAKNARFTDIDASPVVQDDRIFVSSYDGSLFCLSREDGQIVWRVEEGSHAPVTISGSQIFYSTSEGKVLAIEMSSGRVIWTYNVPSGIATQPKVFRGLLVFGESEGPLRFLSVSDGKPMNEFATGRGISASPLVIENTGELFFISNEGLVYAIQVGWFKRTHAWPWL